MSETISHKRVKSKAAGKSGKTEVSIRGGRRIDAMTKTKAIEVERSGTSGALRKAASRLKDSGKSRRVLHVPQKDMPKARKAMKDVGITGTVKNLSSTKAIYVGVKSGTPRYKPSSK